MNRLFFCLALGLPVLAQAEVDWRLTARAGMQIAPYEGFELASGTPNGAARELLVDRRIKGPLWIGLSTGFWSVSDQVFSQIDTDWEMYTFKLSAMGRWRLAATLAVYGRIGPSLNHAELRLTRDESFTSNAWVPGVHAGAGLEWLPFASRSDAGTFGASAGLSLEASYHQVMPIEASLADANLGEVDPSGPAVTLGFVVEF